MRIKMPFRNWGRSVDISIKLHSLIPRLILLRTSKGIHGMLSSDPIFRYSDNMETINNYFDLIFRPNIIKLKQVFFFDLYSKPSGVSTLDARLFEKLCFGTLHNGMRTIIPNNAGFALQI